MFDIGWSELLIIGAVALIVIGPRDLPRTLRAIGQMTAKVRRMAGEFQSQFNEAMREAELDEIRRNVESVKDVTSAFDKPFNPIETARREIKSAIEGAGTVARQDDAATNATPAAPAPVDLPPPELPPAPDPVQSIAAAPAPEPAPNPDPAPKPRRRTKAAMADGGAPAAGEAKPAAPSRRSRSSAGPKAADGQEAKPVTTKARSTASRKKTVASPADGGEA